MGLTLGLLGITAFAGTLPFTRLAVEGLSPGFVTAGRAGLAGLIALAVIVLLRRPWPPVRDWTQFVIVALCLVGIFPGMTAVAMETVPASHGGVVLGILPLTTTFVATLIAGERPSPAFWAAAVVGAALVVGFALHEGAGGLELGDLFLFVPCSPPRSATSFRRSLPPAAMRAGRSSLGLWWRPCRQRFRSRSG